MITLGPDDNIAPDENILSQMITFQKFNCLALKSLAETCLTFIFTKFSVSFHAWATKLSVKNATETLNYLAN